ncbi:MAG: radical SAM protein [bacterium]|nr:radical SAM protein [bacterium]
METFDAHGNDDQYNRTWILEGTHPRYPAIVLVSPRNDPNRYRLIDSSDKGARKGRRTRMSLGLLFLASHLQEEMGYQFNQARPTENSILAKLSKGKVIGISTLPSSYLIATQLAKIAKESGAISVVLGGPYASSCAREVLLNQPAVDLIISGPGQIPLQMILEDQAPASIKGVSYRQRNQIVQNTLQWPPYPRTDTDYSLWTRQSDEHHALTYWQDGCPVGCRQPCVFCFSRKTTPVRCPSEQVIRETRALVNQGYKTVEDGGDDFPCGGIQTYGWLESLMTAKTREKLKLDMFIHTSVRSATWQFPEHSELWMIKRLRDIGVKTMQVGFETDNPYQMVLEKESPDKIEFLIRTARELGMNFFGSWIFGHQGESRATMLRTVEKIYSIHEQGLLWGLQFDLLWPGPSTRALQMLLPDHPEWQDRDFLPPEEVISAWFKTYTKTTLDEARNLRNQVVVDLYDQLNCVGSMLL